MFNLVFQNLMIGKSIKPNSCETPQQNTDVQKPTEETAAQNVSSATATSTEQTPPDKTIKGLTPEGNIPLSQVQTDKEMGLKIESNTPQTITTMDETNVQTGKDHGPTLDTQTKKWFNISEKKWNKLTEEQKQAKRDTALRGMIEARQNDRKKRGLKADNFNVASQYGLYMGRVRNKNDVQGLTHTVVSMDKDNQLQAFDKSFRYENKTYRNEAEKVLSADYTKLNSDNVNGAATIIVKNFSEQNVITAANNAPNADVSLHKDLINTFMSANNEKVDIALSNQVGKFGVDKTGKVNEQVQIACFKQISNSQYESVTKNAASNIYQLSDNNKQYAEQIIKETNEQAAIKAIRTGNDNTIEEKEEQTKTEKNTEQTSKQAESTQTNSTQSKIEEIKNSTNSKVIAENVKNLSPAEKISLIKQCPNNTALLKVILANNPSLEVLAQISEIYEHDKSIDKKTLLPEIGFLSSSTQNSIINDLAYSSDLKSINRNELNSGSKKEYDKLLEEQDKLWLV